MMQALLAPVIALCFAMGLHPTPLLARIQPSVERILARVARVETPAALARSESRP